MKPKFFLITGVAGFIGFHLAKKILKEGHNVCGIDNFDKYYSINLKNKRINVLKKFKKFNLIKMDIEKEENFKKIKNKRIDHIFHFAAQAGVRYSAINPRKYINTNILGTINVLKFASKIKPRSTFISSSSSVYGDSKNFPVSEKHNLNPKNIYATSKIINEISAKSFSSNFNLKIYSLRFFTVYGEWGRPDMLLFKILKSYKKNKHLELNNSGKHYRDFTYIDDVIEALFKLIKVNIKKNYDVFNICSNNPIHIGKMIKYIKKNLLNFKVKSIKKNKLDVFKTHGDNSKINKIIKKYEYKNFYERFSNTYKWYLKNNKNLIF